LRRAMTKALWELDKDESKTSCGGGKPGVETCSEEKKRGKVSKGSEISREGWFDAKDCGGKKKGVPHQRLRGWKKKKKSTGYCSTTCVKEKWKKKRGRIVTGVGWDQKQKNT